MADVVRVDFQQRGNLPDESDIGSLSSAAPFFPLCFETAFHVLRTPSECINYSAWMIPALVEQPFEACELCQHWNGIPF